MAKDESSHNHCLTLLWRIDNIGEFLSTTHDEGGMKSPRFRSRTFDGKGFYIELRLTNKHGFGIRLTTYPERIGFPVDLEFSILGITGSPLVFRSRRNLILEVFESVECPDRPTYEEVFASRMSEFVQRGSLILRVRLWKPKGDILQNEFISCRSRVEFMEDSFLWPISGFRRLQLDRERSMPLTFDFSESLDNFLLNFRLEGESLEDSVAKVQLLTESICRDFDMHMKVSVLDNKGNSVKSVEKNISCLELDCAFSDTFVELISRAELIKRSADCLRDDVLILHCQISAKQFTNFFDKNYFGFSIRKFDPSKNAFPLSDAGCQTSEHDTDPPETTFQITNSTTSLVDDLRRLYKTGSLTDFTLRTGDKSFLVHKMVLIARSPVFRDTLYNSSYTNYLDISDLDANTLKRLLTYMYTGTLEPNLRWEDAKKLYNAADKYQVQYLKDWCFSIFTVSNDH